MGKLWVCNLHSKKAPQRELRGFFNGTNDAQMSTIVIP
jgi:hypothetical protein